MVETIRRKDWKTIATIVTFLALLGTAYALREQIGDTLRNLREVNLWFILLIVPLAATNHYCQGKVYQGVFRILGDRFRTKPMFRLSLEMNFVNNIFPSAGVSGFSYLGLRLRKEGIKAGKTTLVQIMRFALLFISFQLLLGVGLFLLALAGDVNSFVMLVAGSLATLLFVGTVLAVYIISSKARINGFFTTLTLAVNRIIHVIRPRHPETIKINSVKTVFTELHDNYRLLRENVNLLRWPLVYATAANISEVFAIWSVFLAFGQVVNPGAIILAYAVANFAGIISVLPGGIGIYEALMTGVFAAAGVPVGLSLPVVLTFRIISMGLQIPPGYFFYQRNLQAKHPQET
ncbi:MAG: lysylphosphatidylglycerol synthase transmembrane domain-containing protein [Candidatus Saccharibacteria bacterium]|nr:lysylphosphatidylglycerol synthase transmembrane domain-containing protein [Candidatus Saccharibacteria bacterium]